MIPKGCPKTDGVARRATLTLLQDYIWRMLLNRRNGHGGIPADRQRSNGFASGSGWGRPPTSMVKLPCRFTINGDGDLDAP